MTFANVTLEQVLAFRDERADVQTALRGQTGAPVISFTMNIAGPRKRSELIDFVFDRSLLRLRGRLGPPLRCLILRRGAGCAALLAYDRPAGELKSVCMELEDSAPIGRLLDLDVLDARGNKLSRPAERRCLICGGPAAPCARSRRHSLAELTAKTESLLRDFAFETLSELAVRALLDEVQLTPKPGLVDADNSGAHRDMDLALMQKSARALGSYFRDAASIGYAADADCAQQLQAVGRRAEETMFAVTGGVNTHKGAIYSLGLLCAGAGMLLSGRGASVCANAAGLAAQLTVPDDETHGTAVRSRYAAGGARAEALAAFPHARHAAALLDRGAPPQEVLLDLLSRVEDSNLLWRGGTEGLRFVQGRAAEILKAEPELRDEQIRRFDAACIRLWLSPGGSADLLAAAFFLHMLSGPEAADENEAGKK